VSIQKVKQEILKASLEYKDEYKAFKREKDFVIYDHLSKIAQYLSDVSGGGVSQIVAGSNVTISPAGGTGVVTINASGGSSTPSLNDLSNVTITSPVNGQLLRYNSGIWENWTPINLGPVFKIDYDYNIVGARDGINTNYSTSSDFVTGTTRVYLNGVRLTRGVGYDYVEVSNNQITLDYSPVSSDRLIIEYEQL
jgi:hypothetical protein